MRLDKFLRERGIATRAEVKVLLSEGRISINGLPPESHSTDVLETDRILVDGREIDRVEPVYLLLYKPAGCVTATSDVREQTVMDLLPEPYASMPLFPVGRLDQDSEGLLLITNDGALATRITEPGHHVPKTYYIEVGRAFPEGTEEKFREGIVFPNGTVCRPGEITIAPDRMSAYVTVTEGKTHQVRRMAMACGSRVPYLCRVAIGGLRLPETLEKGQCMALDPEQLNRIFA